MLLKSYQVFSHEYFMQKALTLAEEAFDQGEIPVGALVVADGKTIIGKGYNQTEKLTDVTAHAEILALSAASQYLGAKYLKDCTLYVTLEPCMMCAGALAWSQVSRIVFAASDEKKGFSLWEPSVLHPKTEVIKGVLAHEAGALLKAFFRRLRQ
jgi:tRNA(adenine34) deaminase